jgi:hypothetical protein
VSDAEKRARVKHLVREAAWDEQQDCPSCHGEGRVPGGRMVVHSRMGGIGADWNLEGVLEAVDKADNIWWSKSIFGHDLVVEVDGKPVSFEVRRPDDWDSAAAS